MRSDVFKVLDNHFKHDTFLNLALKNIKSNDMSNITIRVYGVIENLIYLEFILNELLEENKIKRKTKVILLMAIYEYKYLNNIKSYVIISEYTELSKKYDPYNVKYISYFLNNKLSLIEDIEPKYKNEIKNTSIRYSHPQIIVKRLEKQYPEHYLDIIISNQKEKLIRVRKLNELVNEEDFIQDIYEDLLIAKTNIIKTKDYKLGNVIIQDLGSYLVTKFLKPNKLKVLDLCAAPGNKTMHIYKYSENITANEINNSRFKLMKENFLKHNMNIESINCDASDLNQLKDKLNEQKYDKILVDVPCSGWGVFKSKPELKYKQNFMEIEELINVQYNIFKSALMFLKGDGEIVYSTCTLNKEENEEQIKKFCEEFDLIVVKDEELEKVDIIFNNGYTLLPYSYNSDGFFMCKLKRR